MKTNSTIRKVLCAVLCCIMIAGVMPISAFASNTVIDSVDVQCPEYKTGGKIADAVPDLGNKAAVQSYVWKYKNGKTISSAHFMADTEYKLEIRCYAKTNYTFDGTAASNVKFSGKAVADFYQVNEGGTYLITVYPDKLSYKEMNSVEFICDNFKVGKTYSQAAPVCVGADEYISTLYTWQVVSASGDVTYMAESDAFEAGKNYRLIIAIGGYGVYKFGDLQAKDFTIFGQNAESVQKITDTGITVTFPVMTMYDMDKIVLPSGSKDVKYKNSVTTNITVKDVPVGYWVEANGSKVQSTGGNVTINCNLGQLSGSKTIEVKVTDGTNVVSNANGQLKSNITFNVDTGFFAKISAFFGMIFNGFNWGSTTINF